MTGRRIVILCNAVSDTLRAERGIWTDSPAGTRKILMMARAMQEAGARPLVLSLGRGAQPRRQGWWGWKTAQAGGVPIVYCPFTHVRWRSLFQSMFAPLAILWRLRHERGQTTILFYNRYPSHAVMLVAAWIFGFDRALQLEDGYVPVPGRHWQNVLMQGYERLFDRLAGPRVLLACRALGERARMSRQMLFYGIAPPLPDGPDWSMRPLVFLIGGTVDGDTGSPMLVDAIRHLRVRSSTIETASLPVRFVVTGKGDGIAAFEALAREPGAPLVTVHGRLSDTDYASVVREAHVGLSLKPNGGIFADTTFPSKVIEMATAHTLVISTDISDVRAVMGNGALYLTCNDSVELASLIAWVATHVDEAEATARRGSSAVFDLCAPAAVGRRLVDFLAPTA